MDTHKGQPVSRRKSPPVRHCIHYLLLSSAWFPWFSDTYSFCLPPTQPGTDLKNKQSIPSIRHPIANEARVSRSISHGQHLFLCPIKHFVCNSPATKRILLPLIAQKEKPSCPERKTPGQAIILRSLPSWVHGNVSHIGAEKRVSVLLTLLEKGPQSPSYSHVMSARRLAPSRKHHCCSWVSRIHFL